MAEQSIGRLIRTAEAGDGNAADQLFAALYQELHRIAEGQLYQGGSELTLGTTTLLHEAYLNVSGREGVAFATRGQFLAYAARAMRGLMLDYARRRQAKKRGASSRSPRRAPTWRPTRYARRSWSSSTGRSVPSPRPTLRSPAGGPPFLLRPFPG